MTIDDPLYLPTGKVLMVGSAVAAHPAACCCAICPPDTAEMPQVYWGYDYPTIESGCHETGETWGVWTYGNWGYDIKGGTTPPSYAGNSWYWQQQEEMSYIDELEITYTAGLYFTLACHDGTWYEIMELTSDNNNAPWGGHWYRVRTAPGRKEYGANRGMPPAPDDESWEIEAEWDDGAPPHLNVFDTNWWWDFGACP